MRRSLIVASCLALLSAATERARDPARDRRVVDTVHVGDPVSEALHGFVGHDDTTLVVEGAPARQTRGSMRYALITFDDTHVTVACTFVGTASGSYDVVVEDSLIATKRYDATSAAPTVVEIDVPFAVTNGKASVVVVVRARGGSTPLLRELRTIQDHNEVSLPLGVAR